MRDWESNLLRTNERSRQRRRWIKAVILTVAAILGIVTLLATDSRSRAAVAEVKSLLKSKLDNARKPCYIELGKAFEGDITSPMSQINHEYGHNVSNESISAAEDGISSLITHKWPNGIIPFAITDELRNEYGMVETIDWALNNIRANVLGITFVPKTDETDYVTYILPDHQLCSSPVGRQGNEQTIKLHTICSRESAMHETLHTLGFWHEQSRPDRNNFLTFLPDNVILVERRQFQLRDLVDSKGYGYDFKSIMHYGKKSWITDAARAANLNSLEPRVTGAEIGLREQLSDLDIGQLNALYPSYKYELRLSTCDVDNAGTNAFVGFRVTFSGGSHQVVVMPPAKGQHGKYPFATTTALTFVSKMTVTAQTEDGWCSERIELVDVESGKLIPVTDARNRWFDLRCNPDQNPRMPRCDTSRDFDFKFCYKVTIRTSNNLNARTTVPVVISWEGSREGQSNVRFAFRSPPNPGKTARLTHCFNTDRGDAKSLTVLWKPILKDGWCTDLVQSKGPGGVVIKYVDHDICFDGNGSPVFRNIANVDEIFESSKKFAAQYKYKLSMHTCDRENAAPLTDVIATLVGSSANSVAKTFRPGAKNTRFGIWFEMNVPLGNVVSVLLNTVGHSHWCFDEMKVFDKQRAGKHTIWNEVQLQGGVWLDRPCVGDYPPVSLCHATNTFDNLWHYKLDLYTSEEDDAVTLNIVEFSIVGSLGTHLLRVVPLEPEPAFEYFLPDSYNFAVKYPLGTIEHVVVTAMGADEWFPNEIKVLDQANNVWKEFNTRNLWFARPCVLRDNDPIYQLNECVQSAVLVPV